LGSAPAQISSIVTPPGTICDTAASARARNSQAAPTLETQCNNVKLLIQSNEKADLAPGPSGVPVSVCDAAQSAVDRNALEALDLSAKCKAEGGGQTLTTPADEYALTGATMGQRDPLLTALRKQVDGGGAMGAEIGAAASSHHMLRGFNIGVAVCGSQTEWGPGKQKILDSLPPVEQEGFTAEPGTVMVLNELGALAPSSQAYDRRVAGVVSGAGHYKPGIVLDRRETGAVRQPIALLGKTFCKVDARFGAIEVGDLLTTSPTPGHAMATNDPAKSFGAVIGKALRPFTGGQGVIPILIALQ
jgi:hypothetical protein